MCDRACEVIASCSNRPTTGVVAYGMIKCDLHELRKGDRSRSVDASSDLAFRLGRLTMFTDVQWRSQLRALHGCHQNGPSLRRIHNEIRDIAACNVPCLTTSKLGTVQVVELCCCLAARLRLPSRSHPDPWMEFLNSRIAPQTLHLPLLVGPLGCSITQ